MTELNKMQSELCDQSDTDYSDLKALFINCTLKRSPEVSNTQGLMDIGATVCLPRNPGCLMCPVQPQCTASAEGRPEAYPVKTRKLKRSAESLWLLHACDENGAVWLQKRPTPGVWAGLYCLPVTW